MRKTVQPTFSENIVVYNLEVFSMSIAVFGTIYPVRNDAR